MRMPTESVITVKEEAATEEFVTEREQVLRGTDMDRVMVADAMEEETGNRVCKANKR